MHELLEWLAFGSSMVTAFLYGRHSTKGPSAGIFTAVVFLVWGTLTQTYAAVVSNFFFLFVHARNLKIAYFENPERKKRKMLISELMKESHRVSREHGWWETDRNDGECIALMHSELSEALEGVRKPGPSDKIPEFTSVEEEMADTMIRIADYAEARGLRLTEAIRAKQAYNEGRPYKHGGKKF